MSNLDSFHNSYIFNSLHARDLEVEQALGQYSAFAYANGFNPNKYTIQQFLALQKASKIASDTSLVSAPDTSETIDLKSDEGQALVNSVNKMAAVQYIQNFYDMYISPGGVTDIKFRLGPVTGIKENCTANGTPVTTEQTDSYGRMDTRVNFRKIFPVRNYSPWASDYIVRPEAYVNLFFPPYRNTASQFSDYNGKVFSFAEYLARLQAEASGDDSAYSSKYSNPVYMDYYNMMSSRGDFTYRDPAFKSINDNITFLQWLFENVTGVVCTYMTEWDLSLYIQEGLISNSSGKLPSWISLVHRIGDDNPSGYTDNRAYSYGIVNAATSKIFSSNYAPWFPTAYPLSAYWSAYPDWRTRSAWRQHIVIDGTTYPFPKFYSLGRDGLNENGAFADRLRHDDYEGAALAGWDSWDLPCYKAFYTTGDDGLSDVDVDLMSTGTGFYKKSTLQDTVMTDVFGASLGDGYAPVNDDITTTDNGDFSSSNSNSNSSGFSGSIFKVILSKLPNKSSKTSAAMKSAGLSGSGYSSVASQSGLTGVSNDGTSSGSNNGTGASPASSLLSLDDTAIDNAPTTGVPQTNPVLFGGPHGYYHSPKSIQSYMEWANTFLRDNPRLHYDGYDYNDENPNDFYNGVDRWCSAKTAWGGSVQNYEHSYPEGLMRLKHGLASYVNALGYVYWTKTGYFLGQYATSGCYSWPVWPDYIDGGRIHWSAGCGYISGGSPRRWNGGWTWWTICVSQSINSQYKINGFLQNDATNYSAYLNHTSRWWWGWGGLYVSTLSPFRYGTWYGWGWRWFKRYNMHSQPFDKWRIHKIQVSDVQIAADGRTGFWAAWHSFWCWIFGIGVNYTATAINVRDEYRLKFPYSWTAWRKVVESRKRSGTVYLNFECSGAELSFRQKMVDMGRGVGASSKVIFLQGNDQSWWHRYSYGPENIFRTTCTHKQAKFVYWEKRTYRKSCRRRVTYDIPHVGYDDYISVDLNSCDYFCADTCNDGFTNYSMGKYPWQDSIPNRAVWQHSPWDLLEYNPWKYNIPYFLSDEEHHACCGMEGWGVMGCFQALENYITDNAPFENFSAYMRVNDGARYNRRLIDIPYCYSSLESYGASVKWYNGAEYLCPGGFPNYSLHYLDYGTKRGFLNAFTKCTFYKDYQWPKYDGDYSRLNHNYPTSIDTPIRLFYGQLLWQRSFLETADKLFTGYIDNQPAKGPIVNFDSLYTLMAGTDEKAGLISARTYYLADPVNTTMTDPETNSGQVARSSIYGYNQWIKLARQLFTADSSVNASNKAKVHEQFQKRMTAYDTAINQLRPQIHTIGPNLSFGEITVALNTIQSINQTVANNTYIEEFFEAYLNVLYEYRRYFVNMRCNKQSGTLWYCRQLESAIPMVVANSTAVSPASPSELLDGGKQEKVAFYEIQNSNAAKFMAIKDSKSLDSDRIKTVYVKVKYTTEDKYNESCAKLKAGTIKEPTVVKVKYWYYEKNNDGTFKIKNGHYVRKEGDGYKYAVKPANGVYRLESKEFITNENAKNYNATIANYSNYDDLKKIVDETIDEAHWYITWGVDITDISTERGETPILFDVYSSIDIAKAADIEKSGVTDPTMILCGSRSSNDYWTVRVKTTYPRAKGYQNDVKIKQYSETESGTTATDSETTLNGVVAYSLWPITQKQADLLPNAADMMGELAENIAGTEVDRTDANGNKITYSKI